MAEYVKLIETRLEELDKKYNELLHKVDKKDEEKGNDERKEADANGPDKGQTKSKEKQHEKDEKKNEKKDTEKVKDMTGTVKLIAELRRLSWAQWRKLKMAEEDFDRKSDEQKKKELEKRTTPVEEYVIDVVTDTGDLGFYPAPDKLDFTKNQWIPGRIRINSEHIIDTLVEITGVPLPQPCQLLHPFKPIVDYIDPIREYIRKLEDELTKAKTARDAAAQSKIEAAEKENCDKASKPATEDKSPKPAADKIVKPSNKGDTLKRKEEEVTLAEEKCAHYHVLLQLLDTNLTQEIKIAQSIRDGTAQKIMFSHLWHLFPPGETIYYLDPNRGEPAQLTQVLKVSGGRGRLPNAPIHKFLGIDFTTRRSKYSSFTIDSFYLDFDGKTFRPVQTKYEIPRYNTEVPIWSLKVFPLRFLPESTRAEIMGSLLKRGYNFRSLATVEAAHREFHGMSLEAEKEEIDGRVIIDFKSSPSVPLPSRSKSDSDDDKSDKNEKNVRIFGLRQLSQTDEVEVSEVYGRNGESPELSLYNDHLYDCDKTDKLFLNNRVLLAPSQEMSSEELTDDELRLLPGTVYVYVLRSRRYCKCDISLIKEVDLNQTAFDDLVLPETHRKLIKSLVERHSHGSSPVEHKADGGRRERLQRPQFKMQDTQFSQDEHPHQDTLSIVKGKGRGLIILLHGVPGVGKTTTAETIAEATGRPLLPVTCGDVGENASEVEKNLEHIFTNSHRWGCVLLLDEAEVFLAKRNNEDLKRNAMVSVFLRMLEYYSGILFLTTNRVGTIDEAFKSRIHISLYYPPLDWKTSKEIWRVNLKRSGDKVDADEELLLKFAKKHFFNNNESSRWNGRQIYNAFKTAIALAQFETPDRDLNPKPKLLPAHFKQVARVSRKFDEYLLSTQGGEAFSAINQQQKVRADRFGLDDAPEPITRRPTRSRKLDMDELPSTSEDDTDSSEGSDLSSEESSSSEERKAAKKKAKSLSRKKEDKKSKKFKKSKKHESDDS